MAKKLGKLPVAPDVVAQMVANPVNSAPAEAPQTLQLMAPSGEIQSVRPDQAGTLRVLGYKDVTPEMMTQMADQAKYGGTIGQMGAAALGFARGASLGTSDVAARSAEKVGILPQGTTEDIRKLEEINPDESLGGELASFVVPGMAALKGAGKLGAVLRGTGAAQRAVSAIGGTLGKVAGKVAGEKLGGIVAPAVKLAAESAIFKAANNISENALANKDLTTEAVMNDLGPAAIFGAGLGAALPVGLRIAKAGAARALELPPVRWAVDSAGEQAAKFLDPQHALQIFSGAEGRGALLQDTPKGMRFKNAVKTLWNDGAYQGGEVALDSATGKIVKVADGPLLNRREMASRFAGIEDEAGKVIGDTIAQADERLAQTGEVPKAFGFSNENADKVIDKIDKFSRTARINDAQEQALLAQLEQDAMRVRDARSFKDLHELRRGIDARIGDFDPVTMKPAIELAKDMRSIVADKLRGGLAEIEPSLLERWNNANATFAALKTVGDALQKQVTRASANVNVLGLRFRDIGIGAIAGGIGGGPVGLAAALGNKALQTDQGLLARAMLGDKLATLGWLQKTTDVAQKGIAKSLSEFVKGANVDAISAAATRAIGTQVAGATVAGQRRARDEQTTELETSLEDRHAAQRDWFDKTALELQQVAADPEGFAAKQSAQIAAIAENAPQIADALSAKQLQVYSYLLNVMPKNPGMPLNLLAPQWHPADYDIQRFRDVVRTAREPMTVLNDLHSGKLSRAQTQAIQTLYPQLYQAMFQEVQKAVTRPGVQVTYEKRLMLGSLFPGIEPSMQPGFLTKMQTSAAPAPEPPTGGSQINPAGAAKTSGGSRYQTNADTFNERS